MKFPASLALAGFLAAVATPVSAVDFDWQWLDQSTNTLVKGTLFNLNEGSQSIGSGQVNITFSTYDDVIDINAAHFSTAGFGDGLVTVTGGQITYLSALWSDSTTGVTLWLGTNPCCNTFYPELASSVTGSNQFNCCDGNPMTFQARPAVPEPTSWVLMLVGFGTIGAVMRRRRITVCFA